VRLNATGIVPQLSSIEDRIASFRARRVLSPDKPAIKINLFKWYEWLSVTDALEQLRTEFDISAVETVMVGDSYLSTHLRYETTTFTTDSEALLFSRVYASTLLEVSRAIDFLSTRSSPLLVADMPYGTATHVDSALRFAEIFRRAGASILKLEIVDENALDILEELARSGYNLMAHIGYTPQIGGRKTRGVAFDDCLEIFRAARQARDAGARAIVLESVSTLVNHALAKPSSNGLLHYSIFSGPANYGGQSINVWDAVFRPNFAARYFPPTADSSDSEFPQCYTRQAIADHVQRLLRMVWQGAWPVERKDNLSPEQRETIGQIDPWVAP
jgi:ketopantoate hydroxymethyltransferase